MDADWDIESDTDTIIYDLCEKMKNHVPLHDPEIALEELRVSQNMSIKHFTLEFLEQTRVRYTTYLKEINFNLYDEDGERIILMIYDFLKTSYDIRLLACKCQLIDGMILDLVSLIDDWPINI